MSTEKVLSELNAKDCSERAKLFEENHLLNEILLECWKQAGNGFYQARTERFLPDSVKQELENRGFRVTYLPKYVNWSVAWDSVVWDSI